MKEIIIQYEQDFLAELRKFLSKNTLPSFSVEENRTPELFDLRITADVDGKQVKFAAECKLKPTTKDIEFLSTVKLPARPLLVTVRLTESLVAHCKEHNVNCLDLNGRIWIREPNLLIDRHQLSLPVVYRLAESEIQFFFSKSTRLARALLSYPDRTWRQADLAELTGLSQGLLSRLLNYAARQGWVEGKRGDWKLRNLNALLDAWEKADAWQKRVTIRQYSTLESNFSAIAHRLVEKTLGDIAFTQWFAANFRFPYTQPPVVSAYRREFLGEEEAGTLDLREVTDGGKLWIIVPKDAGVFQTIRRIEGLPLVCDAQIYLDLLQVGLRGPDQAKALREWEGFCRA